MKMNALDSHDHIDIDDKNSNDAVLPAQAHEQADVAPEPEGLKLLFAASQIETDPENQADANGADVQVPSIISSITVVSNGTVADANATGERGATEAAAYSSENNSETENLAIAALENQDKSFPQILHEILVTTECQSILHWLPDGFSFIIADKQRFSSEILPEYFRGALLDSFVRKLNRWGFRRVKSRLKGEESSFAHKNFVRDKPWLCMKMRCKSKPTYHKVPSTTNTKKKKASKSNSNSKSFAAPAPAFAGAGISAPTEAPPLLLATNGTVKGAFIPTYSRVSTLDYEPLPLPNPHRNLTLPKAKAPVAPARFPSTAVASSILEIQRQRQHQHYHFACHQQRIFRERQVLIARMRQRHQLQLEMQRLNRMFSQIGEQVASSRTAQKAMMPNNARDNMFNNRNNNHRGGRKEE